MAGFEVTIEESTGKEAHPMGAYRRRNEKLRLAQTTAGRTNRFTEWTPDDHLRHAAFVGIRKDKEAREVVREAG